MVNIWIIIQWAASLDIIMVTWNLLATAGFGINWNIFLFHTDNAYNEKYRTYKYVGSVDTVGTLGMNGMGVTHAWYGEYTVQLYLLL